MPPIRLSDSELDAVMAADNDTSKYR